MTAQELIDKLKEHPEAFIEIGYLGQIEPGDDNLMFCPSVAMKPDRIVIFAKPRPHKYDINCICDICFNKTVDNIIKKFGKLGKQIVYPEVA